jgi:membrane protease YdiL (CAAX protease family)
VLPGSPAGHVPGASCMIAAMAPRGDRDERQPWVLQPKTTAGKSAVLALHLLPGLLAYLLLRAARQPLQDLLRLTSAEAQIGVIMTGIMLLMAAATFASARLFDGLSPRDTLRLIGVTRFDPLAVVLAVAIWLVVLGVPWIIDYENELRTLLERFKWLSLPSWHFQLTDGFRQLSPLLGSFALAANVVCEELWFRGYLQDKLRFLGKLSWVAAGLLFTLYHVFEAPIVYPAFFGGLALSGLWALRRDLWSCIVLHALLNAPV